MQAKSRLELKSYVIPVNLLLRAGFVSEPTRLLLGPPGFTAQTRVFWMLLAYG